MSFYYLLPILLVIVHRSLASFPTAIEEEPAVALAPEIAHVAPMMPSLPAVASAPYFPHVFPYAHHFYHPSARVHNVEKGFAKESGHASETSVISEDGHLPLAGHLPPALGHLANTLPFAGPFRSRVHKKLAKKARKARTHKSFDKKKD
ncbi:hypothetical protein Y032_0183g932 [Ancylostoma ceylanicum]|uniref:Uncharacterized protein n=1 Tax=Ancylostoma ceylanicum TaxID=53326 RepID=A0A016SRL2_9BILA|nr:hypothetical protein Y032_0183g932 [Ancylostoma ceylanicum]